MSEALNQLSDSSGSRSCIAEFTNSALYAAAEEPMRGLAQAVDHFAGTQLDATVKTAANCIGVEAPQAAPFGTTAWYGQQLGGAVGMMVPFMLVHGGVKACASGAFGEAAVQQSVLDAKARGGMLGFVGKEAALSGGSGFVYGAVLQPISEQQDRDGNFLSHRLASGAGSLATFAVLGFTSPYVGRALGNAASAVESSTLPSLAKAPLSAVLAGPILPSMLAGIPGGAVSAEAGAWKDGRWCASGQEFKESVIGMAFVGGALGTSHWLGAERAGTNATNARHLTDQIGLTISDKPTQQAEFRLVGGNSKSQLDDFHRQLRRGSASEQVELVVRPKLDGLMSGLFGNAFTKYGEARSILLAHDESGVPLSPTRKTAQIATCSPLDQAYRSRDVFPGRTTDSGSSDVWLNTNRTSPDRFILSRGAPGDRSAPALNADQWEAVKLGDRSLPRRSKGHQLKATMGETAADISIEAVSEERAGRVNSRFRHAQLIEYDKLVDKFGEESLPVSPWGGSHGTYSPDAGQAMGSMIHKYGFVVIDESMLARLVEEGKKAKLVDFGSGNGFMSHLLRDHGVPVYSYDIDLVEDGTNAFFSGTRKAWAPVEKGDVDVLAKHSDDTLLLCAPPPDHPMAADALANFSGNRLIYIGDHRDRYSDGRSVYSADTRFFDMLDAGWQRVHSQPAVVWTGTSHIWPALEIYTRKTKLSDHAREPEQTQEQALPAGPTAEEAFIRVPLLQRGVSIDAALADTLPRQSEIGRAYAQAQQGVARVESLLHPGEERDVQGWQGQMFTAFAVKNPAHADLPYQGILVTNQHGVERAADVTVFDRWANVHKARVLTSNSRTDLALLQLEDSRSFQAFEPLSLGEPSEHMDQVIAFGHPEGHKELFATTASAEQDASGPISLRFAGLARQGISGGPILYHNEVVAVNAKLPGVGDNEIWGTPSRYVHALFTRVRASSEQRQLPIELARNSYPDIDHKSGRLNLEKIFGPGFYKDRPADFFHSRISTIQLPQLNGSELPLALQIQLQPNANRVTVHPIALADTPVFADKRWPGTNVPVSSALLTVKFDKQGQTLSMESINDPMEVLKLAFNFRGQRLHLGGLQPHAEH